jgi:hypothetical protein
MTPDAPPDAVSHNLVVGAAHSVELQRAHQFENLCAFRSYPPEPVVTGAVGDRLMGKPKRIRDLQSCRRSRITTAGENNGGGAI